MKSAPHSIKMSVFTMMRYTNPRTFLLYYATMQNQKTMLFTRAHKSIKISR